MPTVSTEAGPIRSQSEVFESAVVGGCAPNRYLLVHHWPFVQPEGRPQLELPVYGCQGWGVVAYQ